MSRLEQLRQHRTAILIDLQRIWTLFDHVGMMQDLDDLLDRKVDVAVAKGLRQHLHDRIVQEAIALQEHSP